MSRNFNEGEVSLDSQELAQSDDGETHIARRDRVSVRAFAGPLPHPDIFEKFHKIDPKIALDIVAMAQAEQKYAHEVGMADVRMREKALATECDLLRGGQRGALLLIFAALVGGCVLVGMGIPAAGVGVIISAVVGAVVSVVLNRKDEADRKKEMEEAEQRRLPPPKEPKDDERAPAARKRRAPQRRQRR